jgi:hypothetical protein
MHNLQAQNGVQNSQDPRPVLKKLRLHELKVILEKEDLYKVKEGQDDQMTALRAVDLVQSAGVDVSKYIQYDQQGGMHFVKPVEEKPVVEEKPAKKGK